MTEYMAELDIKGSNLGLSLRRLIRCPTLSLACICMMRSKTQHSRYPIPYYFVILLFYIIPEDVEFRKPFKTFKMEKNFSRCNFRIEELFSPSILMYWCFIKKAHP